MLAENQEGHQLVRLLQIPEQGLAGMARLTHAKVVTLHQDKVLLVFDRRRQRWQLPGGALEPNETVRACAVRELHEESSNACFESELSFSCAYELLVGPTRFNPDTRTEFGALYEVTIEHIAAFIPTEEIGATLWWNGAELSHELDGIDRKLIELARAQHQRVA
jgi:hypothetical protein